MMEVTMAAKIVNRLLVIDGHKKNGDPVWKKIGVIMENGPKRFMLLDRSFNPAGIPQDGNNNAVMVTIASAVYDGPDNFKKSSSDMVDDNDEAFAPF